LSFGLVEHFSFDDYAAAFFLLTLYVCFLIVLGIDPVFVLQFKF